MSDSVDDLRVKWGDSKLLPMTFVLEPCEKGFHVITTNADGEVGPPLHGKTPSEALMSLARAMERAEAIAAKLLEVFETEIIADQASQN